MSVRRFVCGIALGIDIFVIVWCGIGSGTWGLVAGALTTALTWGKVDVVVLTIIDIIKDLSRQDEGEV